MASGLKLRSLFSITRGMTRRAHILRPSLTCRSQHYSVGCFLATVVKPSLLQYSCASICCKTVGDPGCRHHHYRFNTTSAVQPKNGECNVKIVGDGKELQVVWPGKGGEESTYHATWLKHGCHCPLCWEEATTQHLVWDIEPDPSGITISRAIPTGTVA